MSPSYIQNWFWNSISYFPLLTTAWLKITFQIDWPAGCPPHSWDLRIKSCWPAQGKHFKSEVLQIHIEKLHCESFSSGLNMTGPITVGRAYRRKKNRTPPQAWRQRTISCCQPVSMLWTSQDCQFARDWRWRHVSTAKNKLAVLSVNLTGRICI